MRSDLARQGEQGQGLFEGDRERRQLFRDRRPLGLVAVLGGLAALNVEAERALSHRDREPGFRILAQFLRSGGQGIGLFGLGAWHGERTGEAAIRIVRAADEAAGLAEPQAETAVLAARAEAGVVVRPLGIVGEEVRAEFFVQGVDHLGDAQALGFLDGLDEGFPELAENGLPVLLAVGDQVELALQVGGEVVLDVTVEVVGQEDRHQPAAILGLEAALFQTHIVAVPQDLQDRGVGRGPADTEFFHLLDQACLGVARRRLGEVPVRRDRPPVEGVTLVELRQAALVGAEFIVALGLAFAGIVAAFLIELQEAVEENHRAIGAQGRGLAVHGDIDRHLVELHARHLARHRALPDQLIEFHLVGVQAVPHVLGQARHVGGADRFVRFLGVLGLGFVDPRGIGQIGIAVLVADQRARRGHGFRGDLHAVGPHVGDQADRLAAQIDALVKPLGDPHGAGRAEAELARGLLL